MTEPLNEHDSEPEADEQAPEGQRPNPMYRVGLALLAIAAIHWWATSASQPLEMAVLTAYTWFTKLAAYVTSARNPTYWIYLLGSLTVALGVYLAVRRAERRAGEPRGIGPLDFLRFCFPRWVWRQPSAWLDLRFFCIDAVVISLCVPIATLVSATAVASATQAFVAGLFTTPPLAGVGGTQTATVACTIVMVVLGDFFAWLTHFLQHKIPVLWEFHKVHHSATVLHPVTALRQHPVDTITLSWSYALASGLGIGVASALFGLFPGLVQIMGVTFLLFAFHLLFSNLRHSHVWLAWPPKMRPSTGGPANHQIHHSAEERHWDKNFGAVFALWDWMFGTLYLPGKRETFRMGLSDGSHTEYRSVVRLYALPFIKNFQNLARLLRLAN